MRIAFAGTPDVALAPLEALHASHHDVALVLTRPDAPAGRGRTARPSPVALRARQLGLPLWQPATLRDEDACTPLLEAGIEAVAVVAYGLLVPPHALVAVPHGWINLHFSLLPAWRGAAPVQRAIMAGDEVTGACTFLIEPTLDTGPVYGQLTELIGPRDTAGDLLQRLSSAGARLLVDTFDAVEAGVARPIAQAPHGVSYAPKLAADEAAIAWRSPAFHVDRMVRACTPRPGAWTMAGPNRMKIGPVGLEEPGDGVGDLAPGQVGPTKSAIWVGTATAPVRLGQVAPPGKSWMDATAWWRGARLEPGIILGDQR